MWPLPHYCSGKLEGSSQRTDATERTPPYVCDTRDDDHDDDEADNDDDYICKVGNGDNDHNDNNIGDNDNDRDNVAKMVKKEPINSKCNFK